MSGGNSRVVYSWDTNVFLALMKKETDKSLPDIEAVADEIEQGKADLVVSTVVVVEMLTVFDDPALAVSFIAFLRRPNVLLVSVDFRVARKTAELRFQWRADQTHGSDNRNIKMPDAMILATAILYQVTVLHTFDTPMQRHNKSALVSGMAITEPRLHGGQRVLDLPHDSATPN